MSENWANTALQSPLLRELDEASRRALLAACSVRDMDAGQALYRTGEPGDSLYIVVEGRLSVRAVRRGDDIESELRTASRGDSVGEEALLPGLSRRATATAVGATRVAEIPVSVYRRLVGRAGDSVGERAERERRTIERASARDLISTHALTRDLPEGERDAVLDAARFEHFERGHRLFSVGEPVVDCFLIVDGLVQLQAQDADADAHTRAGGTGDDTRALAYLTGGDIAGHDQLRTDERRALTAVAMGPTHALRVPVAVVRTLNDRNPGLLRRVSRIASGQERAQVRLLHDAEQRTTRHVFRDLYRMQMARSLLVIDQDQCMRCGHCAWSCASVHGESRLVRRGDKVVARVVGSDREPGSTGVPSSLLVPNSCQHCRHAACMIDCPTGAIGRDPRGEVFIRPSLCTGCGHCAKACPWENIRMAPRAESAAMEARAGLHLSAEVAVKCDLCREYQAPACVQSCPTSALVRLDPSRDITEISQFLGVRGAPVADAPAGASTARPARRVFGWESLPIWALALLCAGLPWIVSMQRAWQPGTGLGLIAGWLSALAAATLASYALIKRNVKGMMKPRAQLSAARRVALSADSPATGAGSRGAGGIDASDGSDAADVADFANRARSRIRPHYLAHVALGLVSVIVVCVHAGVRLPTSPELASPAGAALAGFWLVVLFGIAGELCYRLLPRRLTRLERRGALPEDLAGERAALLARLYRQATGAEERIKVLADMIIPYARSLPGAMALFLSGRTLAAEEARLTRVLLSEHDRRFAGARRPDVRELVRIAVEIRALPGRRVCTFALRAWLPVHVLASSVFLGCLLLHVATALLGG